MAGVRFFTVAGVCRNDTVLLDGRIFDPAASLKIRDYGFPFFSWGYTGGASSQLGLALMLLFYSGPTALLTADVFTQHVIAKLGADRDFLLTLRADDDMLFWEIEVPFERSGFISVSVPHKRQHLK